MPLRRSVHRERMSKRPSRSRPLYQREFGFSELTVTEIFAVYVVGNLTRRHVLFGDQAPKLDALQEARPFDRGEVALKYTRTGR